MEIRFWGWARVMEVEQYECTLCHWTALLLPESWMRQKTDFREPNNVGPTTNLKS